MEQSLFTSIQISEFKSLIRESVSEAIEAANYKPDEKDTVLTAEEICRELKITKPTLIRFRKKGIIPFFRIGNRVRFSRNEVLNALKTYQAGKKRKSNP